jgi:uncharacterized membrane protein YhaH (DUF805 family)
VGLVSLLFSFHGRINRLQYWLGSLGVGFGAAVVLFVLAGSMGASLAGSKEPDVALQALATFGLSIIPVSAVMGWCGFALQVKRFHDRGRTGYLALLPLAVMTPMMITLVGGVASNLPAEVVGAQVQPYLIALWLINLAFFIDLACLGSVDGPNKHGDPPGSPQSSAPRSPQPARAPAGAAAAASSMLGAQSAMERAIAEQAQAQARTQPPAQPKPLPPQPAPSFAATASGVSFGRRAAR